MRGSGDNYINNCLANLYTLQQRLSGECGDNINFSPKFRSTRFARPWRQETISNNVRDIEIHCEHMSRDRQVCTRRQVALNFNKCISTYKWVINFWSKINKKIIKTPRKSIFGGWNNNNSCVKRGERAASRAMNKCLKKKSRKGEPICEFYKRRA